MPFLGATEQQNQRTPISISRIQVFCPILLGRKQPISSRSNYADAMFSFFLGVTRRYNFTISRGTIAPSGLLKPALLVNNQFPGVSVNLCKSSLDIGIRTMTHENMTSRLLRRIGVIGLRFRSLIMSLKRGPPSTGMGMIQPDPSLELACLCWTAKLSATRYTLDGRGSISHSTYYATPLAGMRPFSNMNIVVAMSYSSWEVLHVQIPSVSLQKLTCFIELTSRQSTPCESGLML